jgi:hypothetical protein
MARKQRFQIGEYVVRMARGDANASMDMEDGFIGEIVGVTNSGDVTFDRWWDGVYFEHAGEYIVDKVLDKYL